MAAGGVDLKVVAEHIRTADANPDDLQASKPGCCCGFVERRVWIVGCDMCVTRAVERPQKASRSLLLTDSPVLLAALQEGEDTMLVGGGGAARTIGSLLQKLAETKGEAAAKEAWQATGEQLAAFLAQADREDEAAVKKVAEQFALLAIAC